MNIHPKSAPSSAQILVLSGPPGRRCSLHTGRTWVRCTR
jgi:hypothetical protein